jgi:WD40 repeat protein
MEAPGSFWGFALSPDGRHAATADEGLVRFYDVDAGKEIARFDHPDSRVSAITFIPGTTLAGVAFTYRAPALLDWATGESSHESGQHLDESFASPVIDAENRRVVMVSRGKDTIGIWDIKSGEHVRTLGRASAGDHMENVTLAVSRGGNRALTATETGEMRLWDLDGEPDHLRVEGHARMVRLLSIDASRGHVLSGANDGMRVWSLSDGSLRRSIDPRSFLSMMTLSPLTHLAVGMLGDFNTLATWNVETGEEVGRRSLDESLQQELSHIRHWQMARASFSPDARMMAGGLDRSVLLLDIESGTLAGRLASEGLLQAVAFSADGQRVAAFGTSRSEAPNLEIWNVATGKTIYEARVPVPGSVLHLEFTASPAVLLIATTTQGVLVWDCSTDRVRSTLERGGSGPLAVSPDGTRVAVASSLLRLCDLPTGSAVAAFGADHPMTAAAIDRRTVVCGDASGAVHILRLENVD